MRGSLRSIAPASDRPGSRATAIQRKIFAGWSITRAPIAGRATGRMPTAPPTRCSASMRSIVRSGAAARRGGDQWRLGARRRPLRAADRRCGRSPRGEAGAGPPKQGPARRAAAIEAAVTAGNLTLTPNPLVLTERHMEIPRSAARELTSVAGSADCVGFGRRRQCAYPAKGHGRCCWGSGAGKLDRLALAALPFARHQSVAR